MRRITLKLLCVALVVALCASLLAGCGSKTKTQSDVPLVVGYSPFSEKFSPFFATTAYDRDATDMTQVLLLTTDRTGGVIYNAIEGETVSYNGTDYTYYGVADIAVNIDEATGKTTYSVTMRDDVKFSDGEIMNADDAIFSMYVSCDPTYDGSSSLYAQPILGMEEYRSGMSSAANLILEAGPEGQSEFVDADKTAAYWTAFYAAGEKFAQEIADYCIAGYGAANVSEAADLWAYPGLAEDATAADFFAMIAEAYGYSVSSMEAESAGSSLNDLINAELGDAAAFYAAGIATGDSAANIEGIVKTGEFSFDIVMSKFDAAAIYQLGYEVAPMHYYGDADAYDYENNNFGFTKGDLSGIRAKTSAPMGAGAYKFIEYTDKVIYFEANENYYKGEPITTYIQFKETLDNDMITGITTGTVDAGEVSLTNARIDEVKSFNSNGEIQGDVISLSLVDNLGYGYLGINADTVNVAGELASEASKSLRKGFATLFSVYREVAIDSYYGERASVINYPISNTSWAAPQKTDEGYAVAFSVDVDGNPIYTSDMTADDKYAAALEAAIGYFKAAGYTWDEATGMFTAAPEGAKMSYEIIIPADGIGDHPNFMILSLAKDALATIGIELYINDPTDANVLWDSIESGTQEMWTAAWGATIDPDMYQVYYSTNAVGLGGTDSNHYHIADPELDELIIAARESADQAYRKTAYKACLDIVMDWAVEIPSYQRQNCIIFSAERVNLDTLTPDITTFWGWMNDLELLEVNVGE